MKKLIYVLVGLLLVTSLAACVPATDPVKYSVTFMSNGGSAVTTLEVNENDLVTKPADPTKDNYSFGGWYKEASLTTPWVFESDKVTGHISLYAKWTPVMGPYTVTFITNGSVVAPVTVNAGGTVSQPANPTREHYTFDGWYTDAANTNAYVFTTQVNSNVTLYAKWNPIVLVVTFESNGGSAVAAVNVNSGTAVAEPTAPTKAGYNFGGWYVEAELVTPYVFTDVVNNSFTLYAKWIEATPMVAFNVDGGSEVASVSVTNNVVIARPADPVKSGFLFAGWYRDAAHTDLWNFEVDAPTESITLYAKWKAETNFNQTFKVLSIGNSFSEDAQRFLWSIAQSYGIPVENIVVANMYIGGSELAQHVTNIANDAAAYTYQLYEDATVETINGVKLSAAIRAERWDVVTFQQASHYSGLPLQYANHIETLTRFVEQNATNPNVQIMWHMTWAYQQTSTHSGFANYNQDQMTMYNAILNAVAQKVTPISQVMNVIPAGTAIQNARTSYIGDLFTRDGYHLSDPLGRYIAGLSYFKTITGFTLDKATIFRPSGVTENLQEMAIEAVNNAHQNPYQVTNSTFTTEPEPEVIAVNGVLYPFNYVQGFWADNATAVSPDTDALYNSFAAVMPIPKYMLPVGSEIVVQPGYQYRVIYLEKTGEDAYRVLSRSVLFTAPYIEIDEAFWGSYQYVAFNITTNPMSNISARLAEVAGKFSLYHPVGTGLGHVDSDLTWSSGIWQQDGHALAESVYHRSSNPLTAGYYNNDTVVEVEAGYKFAYVVLNYVEGQYNVLSVSDYQTAPLYIDEAFATGKELIAFIITTTNSDVDMTALDMTTVVDLHPAVIPHVDREFSFISGYWELNKNAITTTNANMTFLNGFAASQPQSKAYYSSINSITIAAGYQVRVIYLGYDNYGKYTVLLRTNNLTGTIVLDETFWGSYEYIAFNISSVPSSDLSIALDTLPSKFSYDMDPIVFSSGYWNTNGTALTAGVNFGGSNIIPRQFIPAGTTVQIEAGHQVRVIFFNYIEGTGFKVASRTENFVGSAPLTNGFYQDFQYVGFNISTAPTATNISAVLDTMPAKLAFVPFAGPAVAHVDQPLSFVSGYWNNFAIAVTPGTDAFSKGFAASNVLSKESMADVTEIQIAAGYQVRVIYMDYSYNTYSVMFRTNNLTGTIVTDAAFWGNYQYVAFNISSVPATDLSGSLETLPALITIVRMPS